MKLGSLCTGYGGLDMAVGIEPSWVSDIDPGAIKLLEYRYPHIPNLGDLTTVDWSQAEPVDIITAGYPCQPFSAAGKRKGTADERHIWPHIANALRILRPRYAFFENVAGHVSLGLTDVLADLAEAGFNAEWGTLRASDVGAAHERNRLFIFATNTERGRRRKDSPRGCDMVRQGGIPSGRHQDPQTATHTQRERSKRRGNTLHLVSTPGTSEAHSKQRQRNGDTAFDSCADAWGSYWQAISRWERITGTTAPQPTVISKTGRNVLNPRFEEWFMGLPVGWVTETPELTRRQSLHLLGNGVVPQQARYALDLLGGDVLGN